jgi:acyl-CoA hydrolase
VATAYLTFVAVDRFGRKLQVAPVVPETEEEQRRYEGALRRREASRNERERRQAARR